MHGNHSGLITSTDQVGNSRVVANAQSKHSVPFARGAFPTGIRFLYLRSNQNQNKVITIGYKYISKEIIEYQIAKCRTEKETDWHRRMAEKPCRDIFSRKIGREIVTGRMVNKPERNRHLVVHSKDDLYNKFIFMYHPDRKERREAKREMLKEVFVAAKGEK